MAKKSAVNRNNMVKQLVKQHAAKRDALKTQITYRIQEDEPYFRDLRERWSAALRAAHQAIPHPPYAEEVL